MSPDTAAAQLAEDLSNLDALWDFDDPVETESKFRLLLDRAGTACADRDALDLIRTQIARALGLQRRFEEAHSLLDQIAPRRHPERLQGRSVELSVRYDLERGRALNSAGLRDEAAVHFDSARRVAREAGLDALTIDAMHMLAIAAERPKDALNWNTRALELAESSPDERARGWRGTIHNNLGWTLHAQGAFGRALTHFSAALHCRMQRGDGRSISTAKWCIARCLRSLGRIEEALAWQRDLLTQNTRAGLEDGFVHEEMGECLLLLGDAAAAAPHFARAFEILSRPSSTVSHEADRLQRLRRLATNAEKVNDAD